MSEWSDYQEEVASFFRELGLDASTNETLAGVRTTHDVDVVVRSQLGGIRVVWIVECKHWATAVPKEKVLALRTIVDDVGADRGFVIAECGFQSGAIDAAESTNVVLASLEDLRSTLEIELGVVRLQSLLDRTERCRERYWSIDKPHRVAYGLRPDGPLPGYRGEVVIDAVSYTVRRALSKGFPVDFDRSTAALSARAGGTLDPPVDVADPAAIHTPDDLVAVLEPEVAELERLLQAAEDGTVDGDAR